MQMRCRECAAEVAVTARVCPRCGAPIVGQPPVVADAVVTDTAVGAVSDTAVSDAAGKAVPAGVAGQAPPEPYVPGSGARVLAELRLVPHFVAAAASPAGLGRAITRLPALARLAPRPLVLDLADQVSTHLREGMIKVAIVGGGHKVCPSR
jgi:hypothetical protein